MATQTGIGNIITLTNTDTASHVTITDIYPALHIPASGSVALPFSDEVAKSYFNGVIRGFMGGAQGVYGTASGINATGNHPTKLTAAFSEEWNAGQKTEKVVLPMTAPINAAQRIYWTPQVAVTITEIAVNVPIITAEAGTLVTTAAKVAGAVNLLGAANYDIATAGRDAQTVGVRERRRDEKIKVHGWRFSCLGGPPSDRGSSASAKQRNTCPPPMAWVRKTAFGSIREYPPSGSGIPDVVLDPLSAFPAPYAWIAEGVGNAVKFVLRHADVV